MDKIIIQTSTPEEEELFQHMESKCMFTPADVMPKHIKPEWNGEGLPPVGCKVNGRFHYPSAGDGEWLITYISEQVGCFKLNDGKEYTFSTRDVFLTPIETPEQKAAREREEGISLMWLEFFGDHGMETDMDGECYTLLCSIYDAGYRKQ